MFAQQRKCGELYEKYRIESQIGRGASGVCYRVQNIRNKQIFAMKKIHITSIKKHSTKEACSQVSILSKLDHPNIIKLLQSYNDESYVYIIMQYACKGDLHNILKKRRIRRDVYSEKEIWQMSRQILSAIQYLHSQSIIHRDVKTLNIFMDAQGKLYLGDLGVSKILKADAGLYSRVGTPLYLAPQIIKYEKYDYKADIWGLGCVCYQLATLTHPFEGKNIISLGQNIVSAQPKTIEHYSIQLNNFVMDMLQKNPNRRLGAGQLLKKYFREGAHIQIPLQMSIRQKIKDMQPIERSSNFLKSNFIRKKIVNNFLQEKISFNECDIIKEQTKNQPKQFIFKDMSKDNDKQISKIIEKSFDDTLVFTKKIKNGDEVKKYVESTNKTYMAVRSSIINDAKIKNQANSKQISFIKDQNPPYFLSQKDAVKDAIKEELRQKAMASFTSQKKINAASYNLPSNKSSARGLYPTCEAFSKLGQENNKRVNTNCADINRLSSENQLQIITKVQRMRPKSSIMTKERHESTMKNIKKSVKRGDSELGERFVETRVLVQPEMIIL